VKTFNSDDLDLEKSKKTFLNETNLSKLKNSQINFNNVLDSIGDSINILDRELRYIFVNSTLKDWIKELGIDKKLLGKKIHKIYPFITDKVVEEYKYVFETGKTMITKDIIELNGKKIYTETRKIPIKTNGEVSQVLTIVRDITEREKSEKRIKDSEEKYCSLFENSPFSIFLLNMRGKIVEVNQATQDLFGYQKDELIGKGNRDLKIHPKENLKRYIQRFQKLVKGRQVKPIDVQLYDKNENPLWVRIKSSLIRVQNEDLILTIIQDITEKKRAENEKKELSRLKSQLLRRTSHELKTPLVAMKGFANLLSELYSSQLDENILSIVNEIKKGCTRLENLVEDILRASKLGKDPSNLFKSRENISLLMEKCIKELKGLIRLRNHRIYTQIDSNVFISCEKVKIRVVLENILTNAIKYTPSHGVIKIRLSKNDQYAIISIKDNGIGFTEGEKENLFTRFGKIERYGQGFDIIGEGYGLGLFISKRIVDLHGGTIRVKSEG
jgi:protein-histidine pros-kinase